MASALMSHPPQPPHHHRKQHEQHELPPQPNRGILPSFLRRSFSLSQNQQQTNQNSVFSSFSSASSASSSSWHGSVSGRDSPVATPVPSYTVKDHAKHLKLFKEAGSDCYFCDMSEYYSASLSDIHLVKEYCSPIASFATLQSLFVGIQHVSDKFDEPLPVRTVSIQMRPDVPQDKLLSVLKNVIVSDDEQDVLKQTDAHLQVFCSRKFVLDAQMVTTRRDVTRVCFIRIYHAQDFNLNPIAMARRVSSTSNANLHLQEACSLLQQPSDFVSESQFTMSKHLQTTKSTNSSWSVREENRRNQRRSMARRHIVPSLSDSDFRLLHDSFPVIKLVMKEWQRNECTADTLVQTLGPGLDKNFVLHLGQLAKDTMIQELQLAVETSLNHDHETQVTHADFVALLQPAIEHYKIPKDNIPQYVPPSESPLKFPNPPIFPWPLRVSSTLDQVIRRIQENNIRHESVRPDPRIVLAKGISDVSQAFCQVYDEEQREYLRKHNQQTMARWKKQQCQLREMTLCLARASTPSARKAAQSWRDMAIESNSHLNKENTKEETLLNQQAQVPLLQFPTFQGTACITQHYILFSTKSMLGLGKNTTTVYHLSEVDLVVTQNSVTKINLLHKGQRVYGFSPSLGPDRLKQFVDVLKSLQLKDRLLASF